MTRYLSLAEYFWLAEQVTGAKGGLVLQRSRWAFAKSDAEEPADGPLRSGRAARN